MNYYPYYSYFPTSIPTSAPATTGLFGRIFRNGINWGNIINNTQKTLNIINQAIPVVKQVTPVVKNAKTMFRVMNEFKKVDTPIQKSNNQLNHTNTNNTSKENDLSNENKVINQEFEAGPTFFA